jgi:hypothetical protein
VLAVRTNISLSLPFRKLSLNRLRFQWYKVTWLPVFFLFHLYQNTFFSTMDSNEKSPKQLDATFSKLLQDDVLSSASSIQSKEAEQQFGNDVEKSIPLNDDVENAEPPYYDNNQTHVSTGPDPNAPPDGGFQAWLAVAGGFCTVFASFGWINCKKQSSKPSECH